MLETLSLMGMGFIHAMNPLTLVLMIGATALGITIGCLPGLSAAMGVALLLPVTFGMDQATGLIVLGGIYCGAIFGGSISAILIHTPVHLPLLRPPLKATNSQRKVWQLRRSPLPALPLSAAVY